VWGRVIFSFLLLCEEGIGLTGGRNGEGLGMKLCESKVRAVVLRRESRDGRIGYRLADALVVGPSGEDQQSQEASPSSAIARRG